MNLFEADPTAEAATTYSDNQNDPVLADPTFRSNLNSSAVPQPPGPVFVSISSSMDGGNIEFISQHEEEDDDDDVDSEGTGKKLVVLLKIKPDPYTELEKRTHRQYFFFRSSVSGLNSSYPRRVSYVITNAEEASFPVAWQDYTVCFTETATDPSSWRRNLSTVYDKEKGTLRWTTTHTRAGSFYFSYFPPFTYHQHLALVDACALRTEVFSLGESLQGRHLDCVVFGTGSRIAWIIHRQHPGETQAEYFAEGLLTRLLGLNTQGDVDGLVRRLAQLYTFYIVPNMCPDGSVLGHLRTNAVGANLNREWATSCPSEEKEAYIAPSLERSPEVFHVWQKMQSTGVDFFLDVHGDEDLPFNFLVGAEGTRNWGSRLRALHGNFVDFYVQANPDMQAKYGYDIEPGEEPPSNVSVSAVANHFNCLAMILEMPYKDCRTNPNPEVGWSAYRCRALGASLLQAMDLIHPFLRDEEKWKSLPDRYVEPTENYRQQAKP